MAEHQFSGFNIVRKVAEGGYAVVYEAVELKTGEVVAIKALNARGMASQSGESGLANEFKILTKLNHKNVVKVFRVGPSKPVPHFIMEYFPSRNFREQMQLAAAGKIRLGLADRLHATVEAARALHYVHSMGYIHKDVKPENFLWGADQRLWAKTGGVKLVDFAFAEPAKSMFGKETRFMGTPLFSSPEVIKQKKATIAADVYSFGVMVYELLTGQNPFMGNSPEEIAHKQLTVTAKPLTSFNKLIPLRTEQIVQKMLEKDPDKRASDMNIVIAEMLHAHQKTKVMPKKA